MQSLRIGAILCMGRNNRDHIAQAELISFLIAGFAPYFSFIKR